MALSVYAQTGGPDIPGESFRRVQLLRAQRPRHHGQGRGPHPCRPDPRSTPAFTGCARLLGLHRQRLWTHPPRSSPAAGLGAAKGVLQEPRRVGRQGPRAAHHYATLDQTSAGLFAVNGKDTNAPSQCSDTCGDAIRQGPEACWGHGYQSHYGDTRATATSRPRRAPGCSIARHRQERQRPGHPELPALAAERLQPDSDNVAPVTAGRESYFYYLWSSAKAYGIIEASERRPGGRQRRPGRAWARCPPSANCYARPKPQSRNQPRPGRRYAQVPAPRGTGGAGYYSRHPQGLVLRLRLSAHEPAGGEPASSPNPNGTLQRRRPTTATRLLVLLRSLGGACVDTDQDGVCDAEDNCASAAEPRPGRPVTSDGVGDACDNCPAVAEPRTRKDSNRQRHRRCLRDRQVRPRRRRRHRQPRHQGDHQAPRQEGAAGAGRRRLSTTTSTSTSTTHAAAR
jgi:hypothetical protein